jgi:hypothetical protein
MSTNFGKKQLRSINKALTRRPIRMKDREHISRFTLVSVVQHEDKQNAILHLKYRTPSSTYKFLRRRKSEKRTYCGCISLSRKMSMTSFSMMGVEHPALTSIARIMAILSFPRKVRVDISVWVLLPGL